MKEALKKIFAFLVKFVSNIIMKDDRVRIERVMTITTFIMIMIFMGKNWGTEIPGSYTTLLFTLIGYIGILKGRNTFEKVKGVVNAK